MKEADVGAKGDRLREGSAKQGHRRYEEQMHRPKKKTSGQGEIRRGRLRIKRCKGHLRLKHIKPVFTKFAPTTLREKTARLHSKWLQKEKEGSSYPAGTPSNSEPEGPRISHHVVGLQRGDPHHQPPRKKLTRSGLQGGTRALKLQFHHVGKEKEPPNFWRPAVPSEDLEEVGRVAASLRTSLGGSGSSLEPPGMDKGDEFVATANAVETSDHRGKFKNSQRLRATATTEHDDSTPRRVHTKTPTPSYPAPTESDDSLDPELEVIPNPTQLTTTEDPLSFSVRTAFRSLPHPTVLLTTCLPPYAYRGMTISSLTSVCLAPVPVISFNIRKPSATLAALLRSGHFLIHLLQANENGARIADIFTMGKAGLEAAKFVRGMANFRERRWDVDEIKIKGTEGWVLPWVRGEGVGKVMQCEMLKSKMDIGDHVVVFGKVVGTLGGGEVWQDERFGLSYGGGEYRMPGEGIVIKNRK